MADDDWHLSGTVATNSGFGLYSSRCQPFDAAAFNWPNIPLVAGSNSIEAIGSTETETFTDSVTWTR